MESTAEKACLGKDSSEASPFGTPRTRRAWGSWSSGRHGLASTSARPSLPCQRDPALADAYFCHHGLDRELSRQWRAYGLEQQALLNCRQLWTRQVAKNRRDVDEAVEKLKVLAQLGALTAGFAVRCARISWFVVGRVTTPALGRQGV
mgnify:CR=1 FL=1